MKQFRLIIALLYFCLLSISTLDILTVNNNLYFVQLSGNSQNIRLEKTVEKNNQINKKISQIKTNTNKNDFGVPTSYLDAITPAIAEDLYFSGKYVGIKHGKWIKRKISE